MTELAIARADGRYTKLLASIAKTSAENRSDLPEIIEDRSWIALHDCDFTITREELACRDRGPKNLEDAILDRLVHNAYQLNLKGESMGKTRGPLTQTDHHDS